MFFIARCSLIKGWDGTSFQYPLHPNNLTVKCRTSDLQRRLILSCQLVCWSQYPSRYFHKFGYSRIWLSIICQREINPVPQNIVPLSVLWTIRCVPFSSWCQTLTMCPLAPIAWNSNVIIKHLSFLGYTQCVPYTSELPHREPQGRSIWGGFL